MPRPQKKRSVAAPPVFTDFKPSRIPKRFLGSIDLSIDEYESIRLSDYEGFDHNAAALEMGVSRPTFTRLHDRARHKVAQFLIEGLNLSIAGGAIHFRENVFQCQGCRRTFVMPIDAENPPCPFCSSSDIENLAARHGHGECCTVSDDEG